MVHGLPRTRYALLLLTTMLPLLLGTVGCGGGSSAATTNPGESNPPASAGLAISPASVDFAEQILNTTSSAQSIILRNTGNASLGISSITIDGDFKQTSSCSGTLAGSASCTVSVVFVPAIAGTRAGTLQVTESAGKVHKVAIKGTGTAGQLSALPSCIDFGAVNVGQSSTKNVILTNVGNANLTVLSASIADAGFAVSGAGLPLVLPKGSSTSFAVTFSPEVAGATTGKLSVTNSASTQPLTISLTGTGVGSSAATMLSPTPGSVLAGSSVAFIWNTGSGTTNMWLYVGTTNGGGNLYNSNVWGKTSARVDNIPVDGRAIYARLFSLINGVQVYNDYTYQAQPGVKAEITSPTPGSILPGSTVTFTWNTGSGVSNMWLYVGTTLGGNNLYGSNVWGKTSATLTNVPVDGRAIYVRLFSLINGVQVYNDYTYNAQAGGLVANPASVSFGNISVGQSSTKTVTLSNTGGANLTISNVSTASAGFSVSGISLPVILAPATGTSFSVKFTPTSSGNASGTVSVSHSANSQPLPISVTGTGVAVAQLNASPTSVSFGTITVGQSSSKAVTLSNTGTASLTITKIATEGPGFSASGLTVPVTLGVGATISFNVMFSPSNDGVASGHVYISDSIKDPDVTVTLAGSGTTPTPATHTVSLLWQGSATPTVVGYNIERGTQDGGPYTRVNSTVEQQEAYSDTSVQNGTTYYYVVTAVDGNSTESIFSNQATATVPVQ